MLLTKLAVDIFKRLGRIADGREVSAADFDFFLGRLARQHPQVERAQGHLRLLGAMVMISPSTLPGRAGIRLFARLPFIMKGLRNGSHDIFIGTRGTPP